MVSKGTHIVVNGIEYDTLIEPYEIYKPKATYNTIRQRHNYGWSGDEIFELKKRKTKRGVKVDTKKNENKKRDPIVIDGVEYENVSEAARAFGKEPTLIHNRINGGKMTIEEACKKPKSNENPVVVKGVKYSSPLKAFEAEGVIPISTYQSRKRNELLKGRKIQDCIDFCIGLTDSPYQKL